MHRIKTHIVLALMACSLHLSAQELEYKMEIGGMAGLSSYLGDANYTNPLGHLKPAGGLIARYNFNSRMALKFDLAYVGIGGNSAERSNKYPDGKNWKFDSSVVDFGCQYELNFFGYGTGAAGYKGNKRLAPYIQLGLGMTYAQGVKPEGSTFTLNIPIGIGVKYKIKPRVNVGVDWAVHFSFSDHLDGIVDPYGIKGSFLKNKDSYSMLMFYISYDIMPRYRKCNN